MCGIAGFAGFNGDRQAVLERMLERLFHRGPDDHGSLVRDSVGIGIRRLSIIDIAHGHQPIVSADGRHAIVFNGEIYNYRELRQQLEQEGANFQTKSDTETILHAYRLHGPACLELLRGMFAFAVLDTEDGSLFVARDRLGIKPLYYTEAGRQFVFASEIKSLLEHPIVERKVNPSVVDDYLTLRYAPGPDSLFLEVRKLPPGHYLEWRSGTCNLHRYWDVNRVSTWQGSEKDAQAAFDACFEEATRIRMISERPVGAFLSGGVDSSAIVASLTRQFEHPLRTYSVGFDWPGDELAAAAVTAEQLGCEHREIVCSASDTALLPKIVWHLDEPIGDGIVLPMYLLSRLASASVTVVQSGEGADEILGGYFMHRVLRWASMYSRWLPTILQDRIVLPLVKRAPASALNLLFDYPGALGETGKRRLIEFLGVLRSNSTESQYRFMISLFSESDKRNLYSDEFQAMLSEKDESRCERAVLDFNAMLNLQFEHWLPDDILCKLDKMTMAHSLEGRVPFMDHKLVELVSSFPAQYKQSMFRNKRLLRHYLSRSRVARVARSRKVPFYIPIDQYLNTEPLRGMVEELLSEESVRRRGLFRWESIHQLRASSSRVGFLYGKQLFALVMLEIWYRIYIDCESGWAM